MTEPVAESTVASDPGGGAELGAAGDRLQQRNRRVLLLSVAGYVVVLSAGMIGSGVSITPDVVLIALGLAAVLLGRGRLFARDWVPFIGLFLAYELMRGYADDLGGKVHVEDVLGLERVLFGGHLPTQVLQDWLHPATGLDPFAIIGTIFYLLHFPLPLAIGFLLWLRRRRDYYDFVAALILLSMAGFATYLLLPVAPPWWAAQHGFLAGADGQPVIAYLKPVGFDDLASFFGFTDRYLYSYVFYDINPNAVAAFPSLHAGYPFLAFLFARRAFGRVGWVMLAYAAGVWFSIVYLADHYVVDVLGGLAYASVAYLAIVRSPGWFRRLVDRAANPVLEAALQGGGRAAAAVGGIRWAVVRQGLAVAAVGAVVVIGIAKGGWFGGQSQPVFLVPWALVLGGISRAALGLIGR
jgi:membrane-associated phospholipid phosphatase